MQRVFEKFTTLTVPKLLRCTNGEPLSTLASPSTIVFATSNRYPFIRFYLSTLYHLMVVVVVENSIYNLSIHLMQRVFNLWHGGLDDFIQRLA